MWKGQPQVVEEILQRHGDFNSIKTVSKRLARISLLFSGVRLTDVRLDEGSVTEKDDIQTVVKGKTFNFTDGCGAIGSKLAKKLALNIGASQLENGYIPTVFQVRFQGYKGVLALDNTIPESTIVVRPSMNKFDCIEHPFIGICDYSKPYTFGHLNKQFIMLLSGLGVNDSVFEEMQNKHLSILTNMLVNPESAIHILQWQNMFVLAQCIIRVGSINELPQNERVSVMRRLKRLQTSMIAKVEKLNILVPKSRNIFGVCDPFGLLDYRKCFLRLTISGKPTTIRGQVVVCKNPCYLLGDIRVLTAVGDTDNPAVRKLNHLVDCIVFPTRGERPHPNEIAGSDLDGDQYFVTWDEQLIPKTKRPPYDYPGTDSKHTGTITQDTIISYFARQNETQKLIGRVDKYFNKWADLKGPTSNECERLGQLFSKVIDASKTGEDIDIPRGLRPSENTVQQDTSPSKYVWSRMVRNAAEFAESSTLDIVDSANETTINDVSEEFVQNFAQRKYSNITEFEKFHFLWKYECRLGYTEEETLALLMDHYEDVLNFSLFSVEDKKKALELGVSSKILLNALNSSKVVSQDELNFFQMDSPLNTWTRYVLLEHNTFDWTYLLKAVTTNDNSLLIFKMPDGVIIELQILEKLEMCTERPITPGTITGILYSRHFGYKIKYILGREYVLDLTDDTFQIYRDGKKNLTFVWLNATDRKLVKGRWNKRICEEVTNAMSVDLQRFNRRILDENRKHPLINKMPFVMVEIYAQSCRGDVPYWDIYDVNDMLPVAEEMESESEDEIDYSIDFDLTFPKIEIDVEISSDEEFYQRLKEVAQYGNPYAFKSLLEKWSPKDLPNETVFSLTDMLETFVSKVVPFPVPDEIQSAVLEIIVMMSSVLNTPGPLLSIVSILNRLGINDLKNQLLQNNVDQITTDEYLDVLDNWIEFIFLDSHSAMLYIEQLLLSWLTLDGNRSNDISDVKGCLENYVRKYSILHLMSLVVEIREHLLEYNQTTTVSAEIKGMTGPQSSIMFLKVDTTTEEVPSTVSFYRTCAVEQSASRFRGQYVLIAKQRTHQVCCIGQVQALCIAPFTVSVKILGKIPDILVYSMKSDTVQYWTLDVIGNIVTYQRVVRAFKELMATKEANHVLISIIQHCGLTTPDINDDDTRADASVDSNDDSTQGNKSADNYSEDKQIDNPENITSKCIVTSDGLNENQLLAVNSALNSTICMIQGPPGTGKTEVACHIIRSIVQTKKYGGILVVAETNVAVDNLTRRLKNDVSVIRVGPIEGVENDLYDVSLEGQVKVIADREVRRAKIRDQKGDIHTNTRLINRVLSAAEVVLTTCAGAGDIRLENIRFPFVLVDEATQTMDTTLLCSLVHGVEHLVLIGDPKQLGPVVKECPKECVSPNLPDLDECSETLFHRWFYKRAVPVYFLDIQYRMHPDIMAFPSTEFYNRQLKAARSTEQRLPIIFPWPTEIPMCFVNVDGKERRRGTSCYNEDEIRLVAKTVDVLLSVDEETSREHRIGTHQIGIITMYQSQVQKLKNVLKNGIKVSTVDGFQGQERDVIVVSTVRCNARGALGFSDDPRRLNVLLTRAKRGLIVVGNAKTLSASQIWARWLVNAPMLQHEAIRPVDVKRTNPGGGKKNGSAKKPLRK